MDSRENIIKQYQILSDWFLSVLDGIDDNDGNKVISDSTNSLEWLAGHLITGRYRNINRLGVQIEPYKYLDRFINQTLPPPNAIAFSSAIKYPSLVESQHQWEVYSVILIDRLKSIDEALLKTTLPFVLPSGGNTIEDALIFMALHESYHIGQMSMIRKSMGYPGMKLTSRR